MPPNSIEQFDLQVAEFARKLNLAVADVQKSIALDLYARLVKKNPVDTGRARGSWTMATNRVDRSVLPERRTSLPPYPEPVVTPPAIQVGDTVWISNNVPYIGELERGHSQRAPHGFVKLSVEEVRVRLRAYEEAAKARAKL